LLCAACDSTPPKTGGDAAASASPEDACIATVNAKHARKPNEPDYVTVRHILVKHAGSKNAPQGLNRTRGEACLRALEALTKLKAGEDFTKLVGEYSDSPGPSNDGALGSVTRAGLVPEFADAALELEPGQMSNVVETPFGFHVIVRTE
jgi:hypothetical protein